MKKEYKHDVRKGFFIYVHTDRFEIVHLDGVLWKYNPESQLHEGTIVLFHPEDLAKLQKPISFDIVFKTYNEYNSPCFCRLHGVKLTKVGAGNIHQFETKWFSSWHIEEEE